MTNSIAPSATAADVHVTTRVPGVTITLTRDQAKVLFGLLDSVRVADAVRKRLNDGGDFPAQFRKALRDAGIMGGAHFSELAY